MYSELLLVFTILFLLVFMEFIKRKHKKEVDFLTDKIKQLEPKAIEDKTFNPVV